MTSKPVALTAVLQNYLVPVSCVWKSDSWQAGQALLVASTAFIFYTLSKLLAAHALDAVVEELVRLASSPVEAAILAVVGLGLLAYGTGYSRILQLLTASQLKVVGVLLTVSRSSAVGPDGCLAHGTADAQGQGQCGSGSPRCALERTSSGSSSASSGSPRKELASHRLNERRGRLALHKHRWSFDVAPSSGPRQEVPRQQRGSPTKPSSPLAVPRNEQPVAASPPGAARRSSLDTFSRAASCPVAPSAPPAANLTRSGSRGLRRRREPTMQRIASGQQLADLVAARRRSLENTCQRPPLAAQPSTASDSLPAHAGYQPVSTVAQEPGTHSPVQPPARSRRAVRFVTQQAHPVVAAATPQPTSATLVPTEVSPAMATWVYSRTLASLSSWAATVDSYLRPLLPASASSSAAAAGPPASAVPLPRSQSVPVPGSSAVKQRDTVDGAAERGARLAVSLRRHPGMDAGAGSYAHGAVSANPARKAQLEQLASAARSAGTAAGAFPAASQAAAPQDPTCPQPTGPNQPDLGASAARSALASVGLDGDCPQAIRQLVTDEDLLQFGVVLGEDASYKASAILGLPEPWGSEPSLFGLFDGAADRADDWEQIVDESKPGLRYRAWRKSLRKGLYVYRSSTTIVGVSPCEVRAFHLDDGLRSLWDETVIEIERVLPPGSSRPSSQSSESCLHRFQTRFPRPMAARVYGYTRRVWHRPSDGGCYMVCRSANLPPAATGTRAVHVTDYISCAVVRAGEGGTELVSVYFDDAQVRPGLAKMAVPKGLWPFILKYEAALRACLDQAPAPSRRSSLDGRQAATGAEGLTDETSLVGLAGGRRLGLAAWRARRGSSGLMAAQGPTGGKKLLRNVVLATGVKIMFDIMAQRR